MYGEMVNGGNYMENKIDTYYQKLLDESAKIPSQTRGIINTRTSMNNGFWDLEPDERAARAEAAMGRGEVQNFFDLSPDERARCYDGDFGHEY